MNIMSSRQVVLLLLVGAVSSSRFLSRAQLLSIPRRVSSSHVLVLCVVWWEGALWSSSCGSWPWMSLAQSDNTVDEHMVSPLARSWVGGG